jgi:hypothetical protein
LAHDIRADLDKFYLLVERKIMNITAPSFVAKRRTIILQALGVAAFSLGLAACSKSLSGTYVGTATIMGQEVHREMEFVSGDKVRMEGMEFPYSIDGKDLKIISAEKGGTLIYKINDDGSITDNMGIFTFKKK